MPLYEYPLHARVPLSESAQVYPTRYNCKESGIDYAPLRRANARVPDPGWKRYLQSVTRKCIESILPRHIHAVTKEGFETKVALFVIAATIKLLPI